MTKTETLTEAAGKLTLRTVLDDAVEVTTQQMIDLDSGVGREILIVENEIRVAQQRLAALQARKAETAVLAAEAKAKVPLPAPAQAQGKPNPGKG